MIFSFNPKKVDFGAAPLMITAPRAQVVRFSTPFMDIRATVLLKKNEQLDIQKVDHLVNQTHTKFGIQRGGVIYRTFRKANDSTLNAIWTKMKSTRNSFTQSNLEGIERVRKGKYAYILSSAIAEYMVERSPCDLRMVDKFLMRRYYSFAFPECSELLPAFNKGINYLTRTNVINELYQKWWIENGECNSASTYCIIAPWVCVILCIFSTE